MKAVRPSSAGLQAPREFVNDNDLSTLYHICLVALIERLRTHRRLKVVNVFDAGVRIDIFDAERFLRLFNARIAQLDLLMLLVNSVIFFWCKSLGDRGETSVERLGIRDGCGNNEGGSRFVDENGVYLVDDSKVESTLAKILWLVFEIVAQIIESVFVVGAIRNVGGICFAARHRTKVLMNNLEGTERVARLLVLCSLLRRNMRGVIEEGRFVVDDTDRHAQAMVDLSHPHAIATREVIVDSYNVHTF